jgi:hypothetical protein
VKDEGKPARACDACYETVFPLIDDDADSSANTDNPNSRVINADTLGTLSGFPSWLSMPALPVVSNPVPVPQALMAINLDLDGEREVLTSQMISGDPKGRTRLRSRPRSYHQILEDFSYEDQDKENGQGRGRGRTRERFDVVNVPLEEGEGEEHAEDEDGEDNVGKMEEERHAPPSLSSSPRKENTARRVKRFSLPAVAVQTTSVTARTGFMDVDLADVGEAKMNKRFSLVLGGGHGRGHSGVKTHHNVDREHDGDVDGRRIARETGTSVAASKLSELLGRRK